MNPSTLISPSSSYRWLVCSGSVELQTLYPTPSLSTPASEYGSRVHAFASSLLKSSNPKEQYTIYYHQHPNYRDELDEALQFMRYVRSIQDPSHTCLVEHKQTLDVFCPNMKGTPDVVLYNDSHLHIIDLKTGITPVKAQNNSQLMMYALSTMHNFRLSPTQVTLHIFQQNNRIGNNTNIHSPPLDHLQTFRKAVHSILAFISRQYYTYRVGSHCLYCPAQVHCPVHAQYLHNKYTALQKSNYNEGSIQALPLSKRAQIYTLLKSLEPLKESLATSLLSESEQDLEQHGLQIKTRKSPSKYEDQTKAIEVLLDMGAHIDTIAPRSLESPSKLKKIDKAYHEAIQPYLKQEQYTKYLANKTDTESKLSYNTTKELS